MILRILILVQTFLVFKSTSEVSGMNHRCYVCVPNTGSSVSDVLQMFPDSTLIPLCNQFHPDKSEYVRECPSPSYQGCLTQTNGTHVTKTCTEVGIEDCKTANKITYCYCKDDLCNREAVPVEAPVPSEVPADDDEDSTSEGSGSPEGSDSRQVETSSEDFGVIIPRWTTMTTTTLKSVVLTTPRSNVADHARASAETLSLSILCFFSFLLVFRFNFIRWN